MIPIDLFTIQYSKQSIILPLLLICVIVTNNLVYYKFNYLKLKLKYLSICRWYFSPFYTNTNFA